jgi:hypothetical protein
MSRLRRGQRGQALVEAAFAVPIMVLMIFGTFYITYAYMQRSLMNGAAFMAARAVTVRPPNEAGKVAKAVVANMAKNAKLGDEHWLNRAPVSGDVAQGVRMTEPDGMWSFLARMADTAAAGKGHHQQVDIRLDQEWRRISEAGGRTQTYHLISYAVDEADLYEGALQVFQGALYSAKEKRIGEPDSYDVAQTTINGGVDSLGGTLYTRNTSKLDVHKRNIGLRGVPPDDNDQELAPDKQFLTGGPMQRLDAIGKMFDTIQAAQGVVTILFPEAEALVETFKPFYGVYQQGRDIAFDNGLKAIQVQQTQALTPGAH